MAPTGMANDSNIAMDGARYGKKRRCRLVAKEGKLNMVHKGIKRRHHRYIADFFTTIIDLPWRFNILLVASSYFMAWLVFGIVWYVYALIGNDLERSFTEPLGVCVSYMDSFSASLLFSIEVLTTIGFGFRNLNNDCYFGVFLMALQSIIACFLDGIVLGALLAKAGKAKKRGETTAFSMNACVAERCGKLCFMFRVGDLRPDSHIIEAHIRAYLVKTDVTPEGEMIPLSYHEMNFGFQSGSDRILLVSPVVISHVIDEKSPLYRMSRRECNSMDFEIIVVLEGIAESIGNATQLRTSFLPDEIKWGARFTNMITSNEKEFVANFNTFDSIYDVDIQRRVTSPRSLNSSNKDVADDGRAGCHHAVLQPTHTEDLTCVCNCEDSAL